MKYPLQFYEMEKKAHELATVLYAMTALAADHELFDSKEFKADLEGHHLNDMHRKAIELAINMRMLDDQTNDQSHWNEIVASQPPCGRFTSPNQNEMTLRDVCNKIIHADTSTLHQGFMENHSPDGTLNSRHSYYNGEVQLCSIDENQLWTCEINLLSFAKSCCNASYDWQNC